MRSYTYVPDDVLEEASAASYQMLPKKKSKLRYQKELEKFTSEWKSVSERQWAKNDERKWSERTRNLVTMDTDSLSRKVSNKITILTKFIKFVQNSIRLELRCWNYVDSPTKLCIKLQIYLKCWLVVWSFIVDELFCVSWNK
jgi:hypothetical protein